LKVAERREVAEEVVDGRRIPVGEFASPTKVLE